MQNPIESPRQVASLHFDSTTAVLDSGSWGATLALIVANQTWSATPSTPGQSGAFSPDDIYCDVNYISVTGANVRLWTRIADGGNIRVSILDVAGALASLPANTKVHLDIWQRVPL